VKPDVRSSGPDGLHDTSDALVLTDAPATFAQTDGELAVNVAENDRTTPVTVIELTLEKEVQPGRILGVAHGK
jgi:hypothetical protein